MIDPRPCDRCGAPTERDRMGREVAISVHDERVDYRGQYCPACARDLVRQRRFGAFDPWAKEGTRYLLERSWGIPLRITWLQEGERTWLVMARPGRPRPAEEASSTNPPRASPPRRR